MNIPGMILTGLLDGAGNATVMYNVNCGLQAMLYHFAYELINAPEGPVGGINFVSNFVEVLLNQ